MNPTACGQLNRGTGRDAFSDWMDAYRKKQQAASLEDFVRYHPEKYREPRNKVYIGLAVTAALMRHLDRRSPWPKALSTLMLGFPEHPILSLQRDMGFPDGWQCQPIWCQT